MRAIVVEPEKDDHKLSDYICHVLGSYIVTENIDVKHPPLGIILSATEVKFIFFPFEECADCFNSDTSYCLKCFCLL